MSDIVHIPAEVANARAAAQSALQLLNQALLYIDDARIRCMEAGDTEGLMLGLENIEKFRAQLNVILDTLRSDIGTTVTVGWHAVPDGDGYVEVPKGEPKHKWHSEELLASVVRVALDPEGTGEVMGSPIEAAFAVRDAVYAAAPLTASTGWRVTALRKMGLDPDAFRDTEDKPGRPKWHAAPPPQIAERVIRATQKGKS